MDTIIFIIITIMSLVIHELAHGYTAVAWGDDTPELQGRLTINPVKHLDFVGSLIVPLVTSLTGFGAFGWAKPVQYNPNNLKNLRWGELTIALAGPATNLLLAIITGIVFRIMYASLSLATIKFLVAIVVINLLLCVFNLIPVAPLDGSKVLFNLFPKFFYKIRPYYEKYSLPILFLFIIFGVAFLNPIISRLFKIIMGFDIGL